MTDHDATAPELPQRVEVVGTPISPTSYDEVLYLLENQPSDAPLVVYFCNVHSVMTARRDPFLAAAVRAADVTTPDGMPLVWALRRLGIVDQQRVYGPDLFELALRHGTGRDWRHFLLGTTEATLDRLEECAAERAPGVRIVGRHAPPFRPLEPDEEDEIVAHVIAANTDLLWVGMGMPKQELLIRRLAPRLPGVALLGVGAAFDFMAGTVPQAPAWMQRVGLEWLYRLLREPHRLWRRYLWNNPLFLALLGRQLLSRRRR
ncbi:MAG: WecB/TagA/CpsF family glycosyltransferase [Actinobacteria bacterium]|nr:WecB/TagA/CpsF family glycosyltransferase [Actinomycetota bacterium]